MLDGCGASGRSLPAAPARRAPGAQWPRYGCGCARPLDRFHRVFSPARRYAEDRVCRRSFKTARCNTAARCGVHPTTALYPRIPEASADSQSGLENREVLRESRGRHREPGDPSTGAGIRPVSPGVVQSICPVARYRPARSRLDQFQFVCQWLRRTPGPTQQFRRPPTILPCVLMCSRCVVCYLD